MDRVPLAIGLHELMVTAIGFTLRKLKVIRLNVNIVDVLGRALRVVLRPSVLVITQVRFTRVMTMMLS